MMTQNRRHCNKEDFGGRWGVSMTPESQKYFAPSDIKPAVRTGRALLLICTPPCLPPATQSPTRFSRTRIFLITSYRRNRPNSSQLLVAIDTLRRHQLWQSQGRSRRWLGRRAPKVITIKGSTVLSGPP